MTRTFCLTPPLSPGAREISEDSATLPPYKIPTPPPRYEDIMRKVEEIERACDGDDAGPSGASTTLPVIAEQHGEGGNQAVTREEEGHYPSSSLVTA